MYEIYTSHELYGVMYDRRLEAPTTYFLDLLFPGSFMSTREDIYFEKIGSSRRVAPFVLPTVPGRPIFRRDGSEVRNFRPAYLKPKDRVNPGDQIKRQPGDLFTATPRTPLQNWDAEVARIVQLHRTSIQRRWEWMASQAALNGSVVVAGEGYPSVTVDFGRAAGHTITKGAGTYWTTTYDILEDIQSWMDLMQRADFGGVPNRITVGTAVWSIMRKNTALLNEMDLTRRGNPELNIQTGLTTPAPVRYVGTLGAGLEVYVYNDTFQNDAGAQVPFMDQRDILLTSPGVEGIKAFGAIIDAEAGLAAMDIFPKMWPEKDPSGMFIMSQSAPLMIPVNPNCTLRARVLA